MQVFKNVKITNMTNNIKNNSKSKELMLIKIKRIVIKYVANNSKKLNIKKLKFLFLNIKRDTPFLMIYIVKINFSILDM